MTIIALITKQHINGLAHIMSIDRLFQSTGISDATVDKMLGANFLSLALIALVMVVAMFLLFVWMNNRRQMADDKRQDAFIKLFTDEQSPLVQSNKHAAQAIEIANQRSEAQTAAFDKLSSKTDEQTGMISGLKEEVTKQTIGLRDFTNFQKTNNDQLAGLTETIDSRFQSLQATIEGFDVTLRTAIQDKTVCAGHEETMGKILLEIVGLRTYFNGAVKRSTGTNAIVTIEPSTDGAS